MKKLTLAAPVDSRAYIISEMMRIGCVEVEELNRQSAGYAELFEQGLIRLDAGEADRILARRDKIAAACGLLDRYAPVKTGMFAPKPAVHEFALFDESAEEDVYKRQVKRRRSVIERRLLNTIWVDIFRIRRFCFGQNARIRAAAAASRIPAGSRGKSARPYQRRFVWRFSCFRRRRHRRRLRPQRKNR